MIVPRDYQIDCINKTLSFLRNGKGNGLVIAPTGSGKSIIISGIAKEIKDPVLILQPSKEILEQNYEKFTSYGYSAGIYSASVGRKDVDHVTFATIGSIITKPEIFQTFKHIIIDECDLVNAKGGMYQQLITGIPGVRVVGLTATPYRMASNSYGTELRFLTRTRPKIFSEVIWYIQNKDLFDKGYLCQVMYLNISGFERSKLKYNSNKSDYTDKSVEDYYKNSNFPNKVVSCVKKAINSNRKHILVFARFIDEAKYIQSQIPGALIVTSKNSKKERENLLSSFKSGRCSVMVNVGVLTVGFDFPALDTVIIARPTMSMRLWYQMIGRGLRPHESKKQLLAIDMCDNFSTFGKIEDMLIVSNDGKYSIFSSSSGKQLTNKYFE